MISIELRHIRYFVAAAEHGSFRKTGIALTISESAISRRVRDLEDHLGASLFHRHNGGVELTEAGRRFLRRARQVLEQLGDGALEVGAVGRSESGRIRIGIFSSLASGFLNNLLQAYDAGQPGIRIDFRDGNHTEHLTAVRRHQLDVAFLTGTSRYSGCECEQLWSERIFVALPSRHPIADRPMIGWRDIAGETFIVSEQAPGHEVHDFLVKRLSDLGQHPDVKRQGVGRDTLMSLVAIGRGVTLTSEATTFMRFPGVVYRQIENETLPFSAVWSSTNDNPALRRLLSLARQHRDCGSQRRSSTDATKVPPTAEPS